MPTPAPDLPPQTDPDPTASSETPAPGLTDPRVFPTDPDLVTPGRDVPRHSDESNHPDRAPSSLDPASTAPDAPGLGLVDPRRNMPGPEVI